MSWPAEIDVFLAVGELALYVAYLDGWPARQRVWPWVTALIGLAVSVAGNIGHIQPLPGHPVVLADRLTAATSPLAAFAGLTVGLLVLRMNRQQAAAASTSGANCSGHAAARAGQRRRERQWAPRAGGCVLLVPGAQPFGISSCLLRRRPAHRPDDPAGPDPRVLREASVIYRSAAQRGERLSQRMLARRLRGGGHRFSNQQLHRIAVSIGLHPPAAAHLYPWQVNDMHDIGSIGARLRASGDLAATLAASFDAFEVIRLAARGCENRDLGLLPAFMLAAGAAVEGRNAVAAAPSLPRANGNADRPAGPEPGADVQEIADGLAALGALLAGRLPAAAADATTPGDRAACADAAQAAAQIHRLLARDLRCQPCSVTSWPRPASTSTRPSVSTGTCPTTPRVRSSANSTAWSPPWPGTRAPSPRTADTDPADAHLDVRARAEADAHQALREAAASLRADAERIGGTGAEPVFPAARHLAAAAGALTAGHDLLQTHFAPGPDGSRTGRSRWATVIASEPVSAALLSELADSARRLAPWVARLSLPGLAGSGLPGSARLAVSAACRWLRIADIATQPGRGDHPPAAAGLKLLRAVPGHTPPPRRPPHGGEPVPALCAGTQTTAERLRYLAPAVAARAHPAAAPSAACWQRTAHGAAITGHCAELILRSLADRARDPRHRPRHPSRAAARRPTPPPRAWAAWRAAARAFDTITTEKRATLTPVAAEIGDLALWTGRLAHTDPDWTPARGHPPALRDPADLAFAPAGIPAVLAAVHHATDALARRRRRRPRSRPRRRRQQAPVRPGPPHARTPRRPLPLRPRPGPGTQTRCWPPTTT